MWTCESCGRTVKTNDLLCDLCHTGRPGADPTVVAKAARRDLVTEAHLRAMAIWYSVAAAMLVVGGLAMYVVAGVGGGSSHGAFGGLGRMLAAGAVMMGSLFVVFGGGLGVLGHFLWRYWAGGRIAAVVLGFLGIAYRLFEVVATFMMKSAIEDDFGSYGGHYGHHYAYRSSGPSVGWTLFFAVVVIAWTAAMLNVLLSRRAATVCSPTYRELVAATPQVKAQWYRSPFFVLPAFLVGLGLFIALIIIVRVAAH